MEKPLHVFCCYARKDQSFLLELKEIYLKPLEREGLITIQADVDISPGEEWEQKIRHHLNTSQMILLLVSPNFIASDYCYSKEMTRAMERHEHGEARVIPIILRPSEWKRTQLGKLQVLPTDAEPITIWLDRDRAFLDVTQGIRRAINELMNFDQKQLSQLQSKRGYCSLIQKATGKCLDAYGRRVYLCAANGGDFQLGVSLRKLSPAAK